jgi:hypothetical protein
MQTNYALNYKRAIAGMAAGKCRTRRATLPLRKETWTLVLTDSSEAGDLVITIVDDATQQSYELTVAISGATEATSLDEIVAAWRANGKFNDLFTVSDDDTLTVTAIARHAGRSYTITCDPPGSMSVTPTKTVTAGGTGVGFGLFVAQGTSAGQYDVLGASTALSSVLGVTKRTDANHFHDIPDSASAQDLTERGRDIPVVREGEIYCVAEESMTIGDTVYIRRAQTSNAGTVGAVRKSPAGAAMTATLTPVADLLTYSLEFDYLGRHYSAVYSPTDGTTAVADAIDGIVAALGTITGLTITDNTTNFTIATAAGTVLENLRSNGASLDADTISITISAAGTADADALDASSIARVVEPSISVDGGTIVKLYVRTLS